MIVFWLLLQFSVFAREVPSLTGSVVQEVEVLKHSTEVKLNRALHALNDQTQIQINVLAIESLEGDDLNEFSIRVVDQWKLGKLKEDKGILVLLALKEHKVRIEVGRGLEGDLPDARAKRIIDENMLPLFRQNHYAEGIITGVYTIVHTVAPDFDFASYFERQGVVVEDAPHSISLIMIIVLVVFLMFVFRGGGFFPRGGFGGGFGGGGFGGGFGGGSGGGGWSGGGGGFSGGGASGDW